MPPREYGILFNAPMIRAVAEGRKTVTRRYGKQWANVRPGDMLWTRETFTIAPVTEPYSVCYRADGEWECDKWTPAIHQPRWAARCLLSVVSARPHSEDDITEAEARREGFATLAEMRAWLADYGEGRDDQTLYRIEFEPGGFLAQLARSTPPIPLPPMCRCTLVPEGP